MKIAELCSYIKIIMMVIVMILLQSCTMNDELRTDAKKNYAQGNYRMVVEDLYKLAVQGDAAAQYGLGYAYYTGLGVGEDRDMGRLWIKRSADAGYPPAEEAYRRISNTNTGAQNAMSPSQTKELLS